MTKIVDVSEAEVEAEAEFDGDVESELRAELKAELADEVRAELRAELAAEVGLDLRDRSRNHGDDSAQAALGQRRDSQRPAATRKRTETFGGPRLKLSVIGEIPGYHLYWENDNEGAIEQLLYEGFEFVEPSEVSMTSHIVSDKDTANRVSRYVGVKADNTPMRAYLLKCPDEVWADRKSASLAQADEWDSSIRQARVGEADAARYIPKGADISLDTNFRKEH